MNKREATIFLFNIAKEIERSFQSPIIFFTEIDYVDCIFKSLVNMREALQDQATPTTIMKIIKAFHYEWLQAVQDIEKFKKRLKDIPRDVILQAIDYTIHCLEKRYEHLCQYINQVQCSMSEEDRHLMGTNLEIIEDIQAIHLSALREKQKDILKQADQSEYLSNIHDELEELLNWLDRQYDNLALQYSKVLDLKATILPSDLTKILKQIIKEVSNASESQNTVSLMHSKRKISQTIRQSSLHNLELAKIVEKIKALESRINKLQYNDSSALMALQHKTMYLEDRVESLQNIKLCMIRLKAGSEMTNDIAEEHIFSHILPHYDRCRLVEQLIKLWHCTLPEHDHESIISILSVADLEDIFTDAHGRFTVDKYGRKIYSRCNELCQLNDNNELVAVHDDDNHVYFYDDCGRYYLSSDGIRVYKPDEAASEYILDKTGVLVKIKEVVDGTEYFYDWLGRYYIDKGGKHIYRDVDSASEYKEDGLGNLVRINKRNYYHQPYTKEPLTIEENKYLQKVVGLALKKCIANVISQEPRDPIAFLASSLVKYRQNMVDQQKHLEEEKERCYLNGPTKEYLTSKAEYLTSKAEYLTSKEIELTEYNTEYVTEAEESF